MQPHLRLVIERSIAGNLASSLSRFGGALSVAVIVLCNKVPGETFCESDDKMARSRKGRGHYLSSFRKGSWIQMKQTVGMTTVAVGLRSRVETQTTPERICAKP
jgi:hypothetical protein